VSEDSVVRGLPAPVDNAVEYINLVAVPGLADTNLFSEQGIRLPERNRPAFF
jgi:hypothetical protein